MEILSSHSCCVQNWVVGEITAPFSGTLFLSQWCFMENCHCLHRLFSNIPQSKALSFPASSLCKNWVYLDLLLSTQDWPFRYNWSQLKYPYALFTPLVLYPFAVFNGVFGLRSPPLCVSQKEMSYQQKEQVALWSVDSGPDTIPNILLFFNLIFFRGYMPQSASSGV